MRWPAPGFLPPLPRGLAGIHATWNKAQYLSKFNPQPISTYVSVRLIICFEKVNPGFGTFVLPGPIFIHLDCGPELSASRTRRPGAALYIRGPATGGGSQRRSPTPWCASFLPGTHPPREVRRAHPGPELRHFRLQSGHFGLKRRHLRL